MTKILTISDIDSEISSKVYTQDYSKKQLIDGVKIVDLKNFAGEDGNFSELLRIGENGETEGFPGFKISQINKSKINPKAIKAWHLHFKQDEIWFVSPSKSLLVGLWDVREKSETKDVSLRIILGEGSSKLIFIPKGVAHGCSNTSLEPVDLFYFVSEKFNPQSPDEQRIKWDSLGEDFWSPQKD
ncbi:MAG: dTDP-4-dehydrorhamnose 3,5-epimerase family protein [Candidatus Berkelbacteria bacterium]|nr:dTDP-4-dehydrorhamnose 3,5-epimerase family protein [Candidatus Berkelbacteria bacterium]